MKKIAFKGLLIIILFFALPATARSATDPFADLRQTDNEAAADQAPAVNLSESGSSRILKKELLSLFSFDSENSKRNLLHQAIGIEYLQRFSDRYATRSSFNAQIQLVYQNINSDFQAKNLRLRRWRTDVHNLYFDFFQALDSFMSPQARARHLGRFNFRLGRFYLPFGINMQTDTHATLLQLSNEELLGFERDWYAGFYGAVNEDLKYDFYWMMGSGHDAVYKGQDGLLAARLSLAGKYLYENGIEGGIAVITGERQGHNNMSRPLIRTSRIGIDGRYTRSISKGTITFTGEGAAGKDNEQNIRSILGQAEFLDSQRKNGLAVQYRHFQRRNGTMIMPMMGNMQENNGNDASLYGEYTRYIHNDVNGNRLEWVKLLLEKPVESRNKSHEARNLKITLQYYSYF